MCRILLTSDLLPLIDLKFKSSITQLRATGPAAPLAIGRAQTTHVLIVERVNAPNGRPDRAIGGYADLKPSLLTRPGYVTRCTVTLFIRANPFVPII